MTDAPRLPTAIDIRGQAMARRSAIATAITQHVVHRLPDQLTKSKEFADYPIRQPSKSASRALRDPHTVPEYC